MSQRTWKPAAIGVVLTAVLMTLVGCTCDRPGPYSYSLSRAKRQLPVAFEWNLGQADKQYQFVARGSGMNLFLSAKEAVIDLLDEHGGSAAVVRAALAGVNPSAELVLGRAPETMVNYFIGADPKKWLTDIPVYSRVRYRNVYSGIDLEYHGEHGKFEHDFIVSPAADPAAIRIVFHGADSVQIEKDGNLTISAGSQKLSWRKPVIYQDLEGGRKIVDGAYRLAAGHTAGFEVGVYDRTKPLVIDPVINYLTYIGRASLDGVTRVAVDGSGNTYVTGFTQDINFPISPGAYRTNPGGAVNGNVVVAKLNAAGTAVSYITHFGHAMIDFGVGIAVDSGGNVYLTGGTDSNDFPVTTDALKTTFTSPTPGSSHCFVTKLNAAGSALVYSTYLGGRGSERCFAIAVDAAGNAYLTGRTSSTDFPVSPNAVQGVYRGGAAQTMVAGTQLTIPASDAFVTKLNPAGAAIVYSTFFGGTQNDVGTAIAADSQGNAYVAGVTNSLNFPVTAGVLQSTFGGSGGQNDLSVGDVFVFKLNPTGSAALYSTYLGGRLNDAALGLAVDAQGSAYVTGSTMSVDFPTTAQAYQTVFRGSGGETRVLAGDAFVAKLSPTAGALTYSTYLGGTRDDRATSIVLDSAGNAWVTGNTLSTDFPTTTDATQRTHAGEPGQNVVKTGDAFLTQVDGTGRALRYSSFVGGRGGDMGTGIAIEPGGAVFVAGVTSSSDLPVTQGVYQNSYFGTSGANLPVGDAFVARVGEQRELVSVGGVGSAASYAGGGVAPGEMVVLGGVGIGPATLIGFVLTAEGEIGTTVAETRILFDDVPAPIIYVSAGQSIAMVPYGVAGRASTRVVVEYRGNRSTGLMVPVVAAKPALFSANASGRGPGAIRNQDDSYNLNYAHG